MPTSFNRFMVGDVALFERRFSAEDFQAFSRLSGDANPLHHDAAHAKSTAFGRPIVPLHLSLAPLSRIAGMIFPGEPSLYLGHEIRAAHPVYYGEALRYSARIASINAAHRVLGLRVLALRGTTVVLDAEMRVQATADRWESEPAEPILHTRDPGRALVTGASGAIGGAVALALASRGWSLLLQDRGGKERRKEMTAHLGRLGADFHFVGADLALSKDRAALQGELSRLGDVEILVHCASPGLDASLQDLVAVNYQAFKDATDAALPIMLQRQKGRVLLIGSTAMLRGLPGMEDYAAAKNMAAGFASGIDSQYSNYGVRGMVLMPGFVATRFSEKIIGAEPALLPEEVAEAAVDMVVRPDAAAAILEVGRRDTGRIGFNRIPVSAPASNNSAAEATSSTAPSDLAIDAKIANAVRKVLRLPQTLELKGGGINATPGWDSLGQIQILLALESSFDIKFTADELTELRYFDTLVKSCQRKISKR